MAHVHSECLHDRLGVQRLVASEPPTHLPRFELVWSDAACTGAFSRWLRPSVDGRSRCPVTANGRRGVMIWRSVGPRASSRCCLAVGWLSTPSRGSPGPSLEQGLRVAVCHQRNVHLHRHEPAHTRAFRPRLSTAKIPLQTVSNGSRVSAAVCDVPESGQPSLHMG